MIKFHLSPVVFPDKVIFNTKGVRITQHYICPPWSWYTIVHVVITNSQIHRINYKKIHVECSSPFEIPVTYNCLLLLTTLSFRLCETLVPFYRQKMSWYSLSPLILTDSHIGRGKIKFLGCNFADPVHRIDVAGYPSKFVAMRAEICTTRFFLDFCK